MAVLKKAVIIFLCAITISLASHAYAQETKQSWFQKWLNRGKQTQTEQKAVQPVAAVEKKMTHPAVSTEKRTQGQQQKAGEEVSTAQGTEAEEVAETNKEALQKQELERIRKLQELNNMQRSLNSIKRINDINRQQRNIEEINRINNIQRTLNQLKSLNSRKK